MNDVLSEYITNWDLSCVEQIATTPTSQIFKIFHKNKSAVLKLLTEKGKQSEGTSASALKFFDGKGAVKLLKNDMGALLLEFIDGDKLNSLSKAGRDGEATIIICDVVNNLHSSSETQAPHQFENLERQFKSLFERAQLEGQKPFIYESAKIAKVLVDSEKEKRVLHGDIHHTNVLFDSSRGWLAIDPQPLYAERTYDIANTFYNPDDYPELVESKERIKALSETFSQRLNLDADRILKFAYAHGGLSISWQLDDGENPIRRERILSLIGEMI